MTDKAIIEAIKNGHQNALRHFYTNHRKAFIGFAKKYPIIEEDVIDIYQDAIIALRENAIKGHLDSLKSELKTYLFSIGKYMIYDKLKQQKKMNLIDDNYLLSVQDDAFVYDINKVLTHEQKQLQIAFKSLGDKCKEVLTLFYYRGYDLQDIMETLGYTNKDVVKSQKSRCLKSLKDMIFKK